MSPGCCNQDPKQPQVASGDLGGLLVRIESQYYIVFNYNVVEQEIEDYQKFCVRDLILRR